MKHGRKWGETSKNPRSGDQEMRTCIMSACEGQARKPAQPQQDGPGVTKEVSLRPLTCAVSRALILSQKDWP